MKGESRKEKDENGNVNQRSTPEPKVDARRGWSQGAEVKGFIHPLRFARHTCLRGTKWTVSGKEKAESMKGEIIKENIAIKQEQRKFIYSAEREQSQDRKAGLK